MNKITLLLIIFLLCNNCSFNQVSRTWKNKEKNLDNKKNIKKIFTKDKEVKTELNSELKIDINISKINNKVINGNNFGSQNYIGLLEKVGSYNYSSLDNVNQLNFKPAFKKDDLIFFDKKGSIIKYDKNQKIKWKKNFYTKSEKKLKPKLFFKIIEENLLVVDSISKYYSIDINTGNLKWIKSNMYPFNSNIKVKDDKMFAIDYKNTLRCYSIIDGEECWNLQTDNSFTLSNSKNSLIIIDESIIFSNTLGDITAVETETGLISWQLPTQGSDIINETYNFKVSRLVSDNQSIFFSNNKNQFYSIDLKTGTINWINKINSNITPVIIDNLIFTVSNKGFLFTIQKKTGNIVRINDLYKSYKSKKKYNIIPVGFAIGKDNMYLTSNNGIMTVIDLKVGNVLNTKKVSSQYISEPFIHNENLYIIKKGSIIKYN